VTPEENDVEEIVVDGIDETQTPDDEGELDPNDTYVEGVDKEDG